MKKLRILLALSQIINNDYKDIEIDNIQYNSLKCTHGSAFFALRGLTSDGHNYIPSAIEKGAVCIFCEDDQLKENYPDTVFIKVENCRHTLAKVSEAFFDFPASKLKIIGITGTNGKTTTTFILSQLLNSLGCKTGIIGTTGIFAGDEKFEATHTTPESLELSQYFKKMTDKGVEYVLMEVSSHALHQGRASAIEFYAAAFTNLTHEHLDYHKTFQEYAEAKKILFDNLKSDALAIVFNNSEFTNYIISGCAAEKIFKLGYEDDSINDFEISNINLSIDYSEYTLKLPDNSKIALKTQLSGKFNIENTALAVSLLISMGFEKNEIQSALLTAKGAFGRMDKILLANGAIALVDYAHTPDALQKALSAVKDILKESNSSGKLISVFGCGGDRDNSKRPIMGTISTEIADYTIITDDNPRTEEPKKIITEICAEIMELEGSKYEVINNRKEAIEKACTISKSGDIILIAGKGHENYQIIGTTKYHFDDKEILAQYM